MKKEVLRISKYIADALKGFLKQLRKSYRLKKLKTIKEKKTCFIVKPSERQMNVQTQKDGNGGIGR